MNSITKSKSTHPLFQKNTQTPKPSAQANPKPIQAPQTQKSNTCCKSQVKIAFRKALQVWHTNPKFQGKDYQVCKKVVSEMFHCDEDF